MKWQDSPFKNPMTRARGLGSQKSGTHHWLMQKFTAVSNMILSLWLIVQLSHGYASSQCRVVNLVFIVITLSRDARLNRSHRRLRAL
jgi:succinate dehydrogenase hydrophobic anchor subunit